MFKLVATKLALILRVVVFYPAAGALAVLPFVDFNQATGGVCVDLDAASVAASAAIWAAVSGSTFAWSRLAKRLGGAL
ncbi:hypothetical protein [Salipiger sp.]|uniref:hypothetical protein n=1 Tax=Salipiger sp. TaxID=2078585 RepID=UPI003A976D96